MRNKKRGRKPVKDENLVESDNEECSFEEGSDSEKEYTDREKDLLKKARIKHTETNFDSDDEVYGLDAASGTDDEEQTKDNQGDEDSMGSDVEGLKEDLDLPDERAWGKSRRAFYSTDYVDQDYGTLGEKELVQAELEEQEARNIQKRLAEQLDEADFGLDIIEKKDDDDDTGEKEEIIKTDLSKLSKRQKQALLQKESPEFAALVADFKDRLVECRDILSPFLDLVEKGSYVDCPAISFVKIKYHLVLNYCVNISFYLMLKAKRLPVCAHPVIKRLAQYRQLIAQLEAGQGDLLKDIQEILVANKNGLPLYSTFDGSKLVESKKRKPSNVLKDKTKKKMKEKIKIDEVPVQMEEEVDKSEDNESVSDEQDALLEDDDNKEEIDEEKMDTLEDNEEGNNKVDVEGKRAITYQIAKNKGLTPYRKKELRNPRVKHRNKYRKAKIRRKGAVREVRKEITRYAGEISGIKAGVKKSIKLK